MPWSRRCVLCVLTALREPIEDGITPGITLIVNWLTMITQSRQAAKRFKEISSASPWEFKGTALGYIREPRRAQVPRRGARQPVARSRRSSPACQRLAVQGRVREYVVDHVEPLACGEIDAPENMQWQSAAEAKARQIGAQRLRTASSDSACRISIRTSDGIARRCMAWRTASLSYSQSRAALGRQSDRRPAILRRSPRWT